ncbi:putative minus-end-directed kinesin ATPase [Dioscorea sansibarensis]
MSQRSQWKLPEGNRLGPMEDDDGRWNVSEPKFYPTPKSPVMLEPSTAFLHHSGHKLQEVFPLKQGRYSELPVAKISEMMKSNSFDNAPTQSLFNVMNGILDESTERRNGEIPHRVACLLRKVVLEIEQRVSSQAEHIRNQNTLIKAREEKYQSRIRALETLATGTNEETQIVMNQLRQIKTEKAMVEERKKLGELELEQMMTEKESSDRIISQLKQDFETTKKTYEQHCQQLEAKSKETKEEMEKQLKEVELLLEESKKKTKELEAFAETKLQNWYQKEHICHNFIGLQLQSVQRLRLDSESIKKEVITSQKRWREEFTNFGLKLKVLTDAAENYHTVLAENRKLFNEVQELKGNIRVCCRIRPFLSGQSRKLTTIDYIGENGELLVLNPSKHGKDAHRMFKFNKVFNPTATQEEVFLDTQPLIRSVLDGYNVCIFAYGQTGSGKTYTMSGPSTSSKADWGVNYRALNDLFHLSRNRKSTFMYEVGVQMVEIYNEQVRDLLASDACPFFNLHTLGIWSTSQPNGLAVPDASMLPVKSTQDVLELMQIGQANRAVGATALNERSSRSHSVLTVHVRGVDLKTEATLRGSLHLVDLAGSERVDRSEVTGDRLKEAQHINKSLSALGDVISALAQKSNHVPYRNSKLTQVLQSSLGGQAKTLMFVQINPDVESYSETISTLKFAERVSGVELGAAWSNKEGKDVRELMEQVASLKETIARKDEEIEQLQELKDIGAQSQRIIERRGSNLLRQSSSTPGFQSLVATQPGRRLSGGRMTNFTNKILSDPECSDYSDRHSDPGSHQSMDDLKPHNEKVEQIKLVREDASPAFPADDELLRFGDADSEERLSDISDSVLSMGTETDGSISSVVEFTLFPESNKQSQIKTDKITKVQSRIPKPLQQKKGQSPSVRPKLNNPLKSPSVRKGATTQASTSAGKSLKRWQ